MELEAFGYIITFFPGEVLGPAMFIALVLALLAAIRWPSV